MTFVDESSEEARPGRPQRTLADRLAGQAGVQAGLRFVPAMRQALRQAEQKSDASAEAAAIASGEIARPGIDVGSSFAVRGPGFHHDMAALEKKKDGDKAAQSAAQQLGTTSIGDVTVDNARLLRDVPVGAVVLDRHNRMIAYGRNRRNADGDPLAHAEIEAMRSAAARLYDWNLSDCTLVVTLEPCPMCAGAAVMAHIGRIVFGAWDPKMGACGSVWSIPTDPHVGAKPEIIGGVLEHDCQQVLTNFFARVRAQKGHRPAASAQE
jgi:tRNA(adenine34) deaminase